MQIWTNLFSQNIECEFQDKKIPQISWRTLLEKSFVKFLPPIVSFTYLIPLLLFTHLYSSCLVSFELFILCHLSSFSLLHSNTVLYKLCQSCYASGLVIHTKSHACTDTHTQMHIHTLTQNSQLVTCCRWSGESLFIQSCSVGVEVERERGMRYPKLESEWRRCWITWTSSGSSCFLRLSVCHFVCLLIWCHFLLRNFCCVWLWHTDRK